MYELCSERAAGLKVGLAERVAKGLEEEEGGGERWNGAFNRRCPFHLASRGRLKRHDKLNLGAKIAKMGDIMSAIASTQNKNST